MNLEMKDLEEQEVQRLNQMANSENMDDYWLAQTLVCKFVENGMECPFQANNALKFCFATAKVLKDRDESLSKHFNSKS